MKKFLFVLALAFTSTTTQANADSPALCFSASDVIYQLAFARDEGISSDVSLAFLLNSGVPLELSLSFIEMVYEDLRFVDPQNLKDAFYSECIKGLI